LTDAVNNRRNQHHAEESGCRLCGAHVAKHGIAFFLSGKEGDEVAGELLLGNKHHPRHAGDIEREHPELAVGQRCSTSVMTTSLSTGRRYPLYRSGQPSGSAAAANIQSADTLLMAKLIFGEML
jgi:hypothetical protein